MTLAQQFLPSIKPEKDGGNGGKLFRNLGFFVVTAAWVGATATAMATDPTLGVATAAFNVAADNVSFHVLNGIDAVGVAAGGISDVSQSQQFENLTNGLG